ncbi:hypothetical protein APY94_00120 [Thermococcus celericrescens]|uniref:Uncharacterized protein n=1 Tax=Thermococcus celericrescens TaxID=227598 RepID=A0A100Y031_9EURY|nr:hypothetical protein [Thermococcus celericrescens]KUH34816.1 hypothetical protein APY94_00120 [Thermococcus celericrescens]
MSELTPGKVLADVYKVIQDHPEAGRLAIELRFYPVIKSEWVLLNDIEDKARDIDKVLAKKNIINGKEAYVSMAIHDFGAVKKKLEKLREKAEGERARRIGLENVQGEAKGKVHPTVSNYTLALVVDIDIEEVHKSRVVEDVEAVFERAKKGWLALRPVFEELGVLPRYVFFTGGGLQIWFVAPELEDIAVIDRASGIVPGVLNALLPEGFVVDNIFDRARIVRAPLTVNHKYKAPNGAGLGVKGRLIEFNDVRVSLSEVLDKLEAYAKEKGIQLGGQERASGVRVFGKVRYEVKKERLETLALNLADELAPWFKKVKERGGSWHHLVNAIGAYIVRNTNLSLEDLIGKDNPDGTHVVGLWELVFQRLVEKGAEDPSDWLNRRNTIKDVYEKHIAGKPLGTRAYLKKYLPVSDEEVVEILMAARRALLPFLKGVKRAGSSGFGVFPYKDTAPRSWNEVEAERKRATGLWYVWSLAFSTAEYIFTDELSKAGTFFILVKEGKSIKSVFNETLFRSFIEEGLGYKYGMPVRRDELFERLVEVFNITDEEVRGVYIDAALSLLSPVGMRTPPCIEEFIMEFAANGNLPEDKVRHLARWIKLYAKPLKHSTTTTKLVGAGYNVDMRMAVWAKLVEFFAEDDEVAGELVRIFKEEYKEAEPPFTCIGARTCPFYLKDDVAKMCPFIFPKEKEILAVSLIDVQRHESDGIVILVGGAREVRTFIKKGKVEWVKRTKKTEKYPIAEWFIDVFATEYLGVPPDNLDFDLKDVTGILKSRERVVPSQLNEVEDWYEKFVEWLKRENEVRGVLPYKKADVHHLFIKDNMIGIPPALAEEFYRYEANIKPSEFREMLEVKLSIHYKKKAVKLSVGEKKDVRRCYLVSLEWFRKVVGEPNVKDVVMAGDIALSGLVYYESGEEVVE